MKTSFSSFGSFSDPGALLVIVLAAAALPTAVQAQCLTTGFVLEGVTECSIDGLRTSFDRMFQGAQTAGLSCNHDAATELRLLLGASTDEQADATLKATVCRPGFDNYENKLPFESIAGYGTKFDDDYFTKGGSAFNEQRATRYDKYDERIDNNDDELYLLEDDAAHIDSFYDAQGRYGMVEFPDSHVTSLQNCEHHAMYCCWPQDRQANDNNGNCDDPYDDNCLDSDPADNTDLCYSTNESSKLVFPGEDNNNQRRAEGPIHCHGTAWADSSTADTSWAFRGNNVFYISMYDHLYQRGYVRNIPGSAMCGCAEDVSAFVTTTTTTAAAAAAAAEPHDCLVGPLQQIVMPSCLFVWLSFLRHHQHCHSHLPYPPNRSPTTYHNRCLSLLGLTVPKWTSILRWISSTMVPHGP